MTDSRRTPGHVDSDRKPVDYDDFVVATRQLGLYWTKTNLPPPLGLDRDG